jgi:hypothetical protein
MNMQQNLQMDMIMYAISIQKNYHSIVGRRNKSLMEKLPLPRCEVARQRFETFITKQSIYCQNKSDGVECLDSLCRWIYDDESDEVVEESSED